MARGSRGMTLVEVIMTVTMIAVTSLTLLPLFGVTGKRYTSLDAGNILSARAREAVADTQRRLSDARRVYTSDADGTELLSRMASQIDPPALPGSRLPGVQVSSAAVDGAWAGNSLLFAAAGVSMDLGELPDGRGAQVRVITPSIGIHHYYLAADTLDMIGGKKVRRLWRWSSAPYADYRALTAMPDVTLRNNSIAALLRRGCRHALDPSTSTAAAFYTLSPDMPWIAPDPTHAPQKGDAAALIDLSKETTLGYFVTSVSPNTDALFTHAHPVPSLAVAADDFPSGFETLVWEAPEGRRVQARLVLAAEGGFKGYLSQEYVISSASRP